MLAALKQLVLIVSVLVRLPVWTLLALPRSWRPRRSWSLTRCLWVKILKATVRFGEYAPLRLNACRCDC